MGKNTPLASSCRYQSREKETQLCSRRHDSEGNHQQDQPRNETWPESRRFLTTQTALCDAGVARSTNGLVAF